MNRAARMGRTVPSNIIESWNHRILEVRRIFEIDLLLHIQLLCLCLLSDLLISLSFSSAGLNFYEFGPICSTH